MKKNLLLLLFSIGLFSAHAQTYDGLDQSIIDFLIENGIDHDNEFIKNKSISFRNEYKLDSVYLYEDEIDNLTEKTVYSAHNGINQIGTIAESFDYEIMEWVPHDVITRSFDENGNQLSYLQEEYIDGVLVLEDKIDYYLNASGFDTLVISSTWEADIQDWEPNFKFVTVLDDDNNPETYEVLRWDDDLLIWNRLALTSYIFENNMLTESTSASELFSGGIRITNSIYFNNSEGVDSIYRYIGEDINDLVLDRKSVFSNPDELTSIRLNSDYVAFNDSWDPRKRDETIKYADNLEDRYTDNYDSTVGSTTFVFDNRDEYFYSPNILNPLNTEVTIDKNIAINVANPFSRADLVTIEGITPGTATTFSIMDIGGNVILQKQFSSDIQFTIDQQSSNGIYIMSLIQNNNVVSNRKVVKQH